MNGDEHGRAHGACAESARVFTGIIQRKCEKSKPERKKKHLFAEKNAFQGGSGRFFRRENHRDDAFKTRSLSLAT